MAAEEKLLNLFDTYWFEHFIFSHKPTHPTNPSPQNHEPKVSCLPSLHVRSLSDQFLSPKTNFSSKSFSPNSLLAATKLQTIYSSKEVEEFTEPIVKTEDMQIPIKKKVSERRRKGEIGNSKSLSELEFEELKGFIDLGFVFAEEDKDSSLVSIIPGLQRLGKNGGEDETKGEKMDEAMVSRPYLSEAWDVLDQTKVNNALMNWRVPALGTDMDMKDHLRFWAHSVLSTVR